jgi:hypothetical protein
MANLGCIGRRHRPADVPSRAVKNEPMANRDTWHSAPGCYLIAAVAGDPHSRISNQSDSGSGRTAPGRPGGTIYAQNCEDVLHRIRQRTLLTPAGSRPKGDSMRPFPCWIGPATGSAFPGAQARDQQSAHEARSGRLFRALDTDHDGQLSPEEMIAAPAVLLALDQNGDGKLSAVECRANLGDVSRLSPSQLCAACMQFMRSSPSLSALDADDNGEISAREIRDAEQELRHSRPRPRWSAADNRNRSA